MLYELYNILTNYTILIEEHLKHLHRVAEKKCFCLSVKGGESEGVTNPQHPTPPPPSGAYPIRLGVSQVGAHNFPFRQFLLTTAVFC